jgi:3,4-dihydroxy 2-butanone 4-phosphate synthase/GTP cyclohydrolase II
MLALCLGTIDGSPTLVRVQMGSTLGDIFGAPHPKRIHASEAMRRIDEEGKGVLLFVPQRSDLIVDLDHYAEGVPRPGGNALEHEIVLRDVGFGSQVLKDLGVRKMRLLTNRPSRIAGVDGFELEVVEQVLLRSNDEATADASVHTTH